MTGCSYQKEITREGLTGDNYKDFEQCSFNYTQKIIEFNNPDDLKDTMRIELCETHFHEVFDKYTRPEAIAESKYNSEFKRISLVKADLKEAHDYEMYQQYSKNPSIYKNLNDYKLAWDYLKFKKCHNDLCANELQGTARKIFSVLIFNKRGGLEKKLNLCSYQCWNKIRLYIGIVKRKQVHPLPKTLEVYF